MFAYPVRGAARLRRRRPPRRAGRGTAGTALRRGGGPLPLRTASSARRPRPEPARGRRRRRLTAGLARRPCQPCVRARGGGAARIGPLRRGRPRDHRASAGSVENLRDRRRSRRRSRAGGNVRDAPGSAEAVRRFLAFAGDSVLVAHNARFDLAFLDREVERLTGRRVAAPVVDTVGLARRLLAGRVSRVSLASLAHFFGTSVRPCHRALPDAQATAEVLIALLGLAQERGAQTIADLCRLAAPRRRRIYDKRSLAFGAPSRPGVYLFRGTGDQVLYVGRARELRARLRSYFRTERQRPAG